MSINVLVIYFWLHTYLSSCALIIQRAKRNCWQQDSNVEEDGRGGVLQQRSVRAQNTWRETTQQQTPQPEQQIFLIYLVKVKSSRDLRKTETRHLWSQTGTVEACGTSPHKCHDLLWGNLLPGYKRRFGGEKIIIMCFFFFFFFLCIIAELIES